MNLALIEPGQIELVDDTRLIGIVDGIAGYELMRERLIEVRLARIDRRARRPIRAAKLVAEEIIARGRSHDLVMGGGR